MNKHKHTTLLTLLLLALTTLALNTPQANAHATRELITSFGNMERPAGIAINQETGNVYVVDNKTFSVKIFGPDGGPPLDGAPTEITGLHLYEEAFDRNPSGIAVDNSCYEHQPRLTGKACEEYDPSYGDIYVINTNTIGNTTLGEPGFQRFRLDPGHGYKLTEEIPCCQINPPSYPTKPDGVTIDSRGDIFAVSKEYGQLFELKKHVEKVVTGGVEEFKDNREEIGIPQNIVTGNDGPGYLAVDYAGELYVGSHIEELKSDKGVGRLKLGPNNEVLAEEVFTGRVLGGVARPVAVEPSGDAVFVGNGPEVAEYNKGGELQLTFGSIEPLGGSLGKAANGVKAIAYNPVNDHVYVVNPLHGDVDVFGGVVGPPVVEATQPAVSGVSRTSALLAGTASPESGQANYYFEYAPEEEYEPAASDPYAQGGRTAITAMAGGHVAETIERVVLSGLRPGTTYHYRLVVSNATATTYGPDEMFTTAPATPPVVLTGPAGDVSTTGATLSGTVGSQGLPTSYVFEVGPSMVYGGARLFGDAGSGTGTVVVTVGLQYLAPGTTYHYRLVATSFDGTSYGQDATFTTASVPAPVGQPASTPLIASPVLPFPSIAGAITQPRSKPSNGTVSQKKLKHALRACHKQHSRARRSRCEARAHKQYGGTASSRTANTNHPRRK